MLLKNVLDIQFRSRELTRSNFQSCCKLIDYLNDRGLTNALELQMDSNVLEESCFSDRDINLFVAYFAFDEYPLNTKKQVFLAELIIHFFFPKGLDLMKETEVRYFFVIAASYFHDCFPNYDRKVLGSIIRKSEKLIAYKQGGYVLKNDVEKMWEKENLKILQLKIKEVLKTKNEIEPKELFEEYKELLQGSQINNSHYMFSVLKSLNTDNDIVYYRNTFNSKIRRRKKI